MNISIEKAYNSWS